MKAKNVQTSVSSETVYHEGSAEIVIGKKTIEIEFTLTEMHDYNNGFTEKEITIISDLPKGAKEEEVKKAILEGLYNNEE